MERFILSVIIVAIKKVKLFNSYNLSSHFFNVYT